jgi:hypothetical protein
LFFRAFHGRVGDGEYVLDQHVDPTRHKGKALSKMERRLEHFFGAQSLSLCMYARDH